jgi:hypothetical protein
MTLTEAQNWISAHAVIEQGYYLDGDNGQPNPSVVYCRKHASTMARRLTKNRRKTILEVQYNYCEAWGGSDLVEWCGIKSCGITLDSGGLTDDGVRWALGMDEEHPVSFVASIDELELVQRAMKGNSVRLQTKYNWQLWLSQVLRRQKGITKKQRLAFEAAWLVGETAFALDLLRRRRRA